MQCGDQAADARVDAVFGGQEHAVEVADLPERADEGVQGEFAPRDARPPPPRPGGEDGDRDDEPPGEQGARGGALGAELRADEPRAPQDDESGPEQGVLPLRGHAVLL
ncbi:hypothetical protein GCM10010182_22130 [Actinomadura cremea]|nr:hypothetical protein GCM10010182_22130 [Actinomadura cremea]